MPASYIQVKPDDPTGKKVQTFVDGSGNHAQAVVLVDETGTPFTPITSIPAYLTARIDPGGSDSTGAVGDLAPPFLTVQAAIDAIEALGLEDASPLIDIGNNSFGETLTTSLTKLHFKGANANVCTAFTQLTFTANDSINLGLYSCTVGSGGLIFQTTVNVNVILENVELNGNITAASSPLYVHSDVGSCAVRNITGGGTLDLAGLESFIPVTISAPGFDINISGCFNRFADNGDPVGAIINSAGSEVWATNSIISSVTAADTLHLIDSRVIGTNNAGSTVYDDVLLTPRWGKIGGTLSDQTDLQSALDAKADDTDLAGYVPTTRTVNGHALSGNVTVTASDVGAPSGSGSSSGTNTGDQTSVSGNAGTATALQTARNIDGQSFDGTANITVIAPGTHAATGKTTPVDADEVPLVDSAASNVLKKLTWANLKATLKTYLDNLYVSISGALGTPSSGTLTNCTGLPEAGLTTADNTTADVSTTKHGFQPKAPNDTTKFMDGTGAYATLPDLDFSRIIAPWDFLAGRTGNTLTNGSGASIQGSTESLVTGSGGYQPTYEALTGTTTTGGAASTLCQTAVTSRGAFRLANFTTLEMFMCVRIPTLSDGTDTFKVGIGFVDARSGNVSAAPTNGAYCSIAGSTLNASALASSVESNTAWGTTFAAATWYKVRVVWTIGTSVAVYVNGTLAATQSSGLPASTVDVMPEIWILKSAGTNSRTAYFARGYLIVK